MTVAVILGSAWQTPTIGGRTLTAVEVKTRFGPATVHRWDRPDGPAWALFRHGAPHRFLPNQVPYRAQALALAEVGVESVLITSSVGVMDLSVPLFRPLLVDDLVWLDNRLPDGSTCTLFPEPTPGQGHLIVDHGLFDRELGAQIGALAAELGDPIAGRVEFVYVGGPRTKTGAENRWLARLGAQVNSMTLAPEAVLLAEAGIAVAAVVTGHKHSHPDAAKAPMDTVDVSKAAAIDDSLVRSRAAIEALAVAWLETGRPVPYKNRLHHLGRSES